MRVDERLRRARAEEARLARASEKAADWREAGACFGYNDDSMYPDSNREQREVAQLCRLACPVQAQCLDYALRADERHGVWGGTTERERERLRRRAGGERP